jgi:acyl-CoA thioesterase FadM
MDGYRHVNNAIYLNYLEESRDRVMEVLFGANGFDFVLAHVDIDFRNELTQSDGDIVVKSRVAGFGRSSVRTREVVYKPDGTVAAEAGAVSVPRDNETGNSRPLTDQERAVLEASLAADEQAGHDF